MKKKEYKENGEIFQRTFKHIGHIKKILQIMESCNRRNFRYN